MICPTTHSCFQQTINKDTVSILDLFIDWTDFLEGSTPQNTVWQIEEADDDGDLTIVAVDPISDLVGTSVSRVRVAGGNPGSTYQICNTVTAADGRVDRKCILITVHTHDNLVDYNFVTARGTAYSSHVFVTGGSLIDPTSVTLTSSHAISTTGKIVHNATAAQAASHTLTTAGTIVPEGTANVTGTHKLTTEGHLITPGVGAITGRHKLTTGGVALDVDLQADQTASHALATGGIVIVRPVPAKFVESHALTTGGQAFTPPVIPPTTSWMGVGEDAITKRTIFDTTGYNTVLVTNQSELNTAVQNVKNGTVDQVWLRPLAGSAEYQFPKSALCPYDRQAFGWNPRTHPAIFRTEPSAMPTRAKMYDLGGNTGLSRFGVMSGLAFVDLQLDHNPAVTGIWNHFVDWVLYDGGSWMLYENCIMNLSIVNQNTDANPLVPPNRPMLGVCCRFCFSNNPHLTTTGHIQGWYTSGTSVWAEYCTWWKSGWTGTRGTLDSQGGATIFKHAFYYDKHNFPAVIGDGIMRKCVIASPSSHGIYARPGGSVTDNLLLRCPYSQIGYSGDNKTWFYSTGEVKRNVWIESDDISVPPAANQPRGIGLALDMMKNCDVEDNIMVHNNTSAANNDCFRLTGLYNFDSTVRFINNKSHNWGRAFFASNPSYLSQVQYSGNHLDDGTTFVDPDRILSDYNEDVVIPEIIAGTAGTGAEGAQPYTFSANWIDGVLADCQAWMAIV